MWSLLSEVLVDVLSLNQFGEVNWTLSSVDEVGLHHGAQLELYTAVNWKPVEVSEGGGDVIVRSKVHCEANSGVLYSLQRSYRQFQ